MKFNSRKLPQKPILRDCKLVEVTDPAELAALDLRCRVAEKAAAEESRPPKPKARRTK